MSDSQNFGFGQFVPGFDFLQNLAKGASGALPQMPTLASWVAPTLNIEDIDKRISELRTVQFWLEQNGKALAATIQALEVQKMTLATLQGMNVSMSEMAEALKVRPAAEAPPAPPQEKPAPKAEAAATPEAPGGGAAATAAVDPLQWWGSLTQQFQAIAANALQGAAQHAGADTARSMADAAGQAMKTAAATAAHMTEVATSGLAAAQAPARKSAARAKAPAGKAKGAATQRAPAKAARKTTARTGRG